MEKNTKEDSKYTFIFNDLGSGITDNKRYKVDYTFKDESNYSEELFSLCLKNNLPINYFDEFSPLLNCIIEQTGKDEKFYNEKDLDDLQSKSFYENKIKELINVNNSKVDLKVKNNINENIENNIVNSTYEKLKLLNCFKKNESLIRIEKSLSNEIDKFFIDKSNDEQTIRNKQMDEMQEANLKNIPLEPLVNFHIEELDNFSKDCNDKLIKLIENKRSIYHNEIKSLYDKYFSNFKENISQYQKENNIIENNNNNSGTIKEDYTYITLDKFLIKNKNKQSIVNIYFFEVNNILNNRIKEYFNNKSNINKPSSSINELLYGDNLFAFINYYTLNTIENKIETFIPNFANLKEILNELYFENVIELYEKMKKEKDFNKNIYISKYSNRNMFEIIFHIYIPKDKTETNLINSIKEVLYAANIYKLSFLVIPLEILLQNFYKANKYSDFNIIMDNIKQTVNIIKNEYKNISNNIK